MAATAQTSVAFAAGGARTLPVQRTLAKPSTTFVSAWTFWKMGFNSLKLGYGKNNTLPSRKLSVRAARTESQGVSLGFRAPHFEVCTILYGFVVI